MAGGVARARAAFRRLFRADNTTASSPRFGMAGGVAPRYEQLFEEAGEETGALLEETGGETAGYLELTRATSCSSRLGMARGVEARHVQPFEETGGETGVLFEETGGERAGYSERACSSLLGMAGGVAPQLKPLPEEKGEKTGTGVYTEVTVAVEQITASRVGRLHSWGPLFWIVWWYRNFYWLSIAALGWWSLPYTTAEGGTGWQVYLVYALLLMLHLRIELYLMECLQNDEISPVNRFCSRTGCPKKASVPILLLLSFLDHLDGHRDAWNISFLLKSERHIHESWLNSWRISAVPAVDTLITFLDRAGFCGVMLWQFLSFTVASQLLALGPMGCCELAGYLICVWAPDLVHNALRDADFTVMTLVVVAVGVPVPLSRLAMFWAWCWQGEEDNIEDFVWRYGMTGLVMITAWKMFIELIYSPLLFIKKNWLNYHNGDPLASDEPTRIEFTIKCSEGGGLIAFSTLCARYSSDPNGCDRDLVELQGVRFAANKAMLENCRELWMQASFFSFTKASMGPVAQAKFLALFVLGIFSVMAKVKDYFHCLQKYYGRGTSVLKLPEPPAHFSPQEYPSIKHWIDVWISHFHALQANAVRQCIIWIQDLTNSRFFRTVYILKV